jgi:hypothetical protein
MLRLVEATNILFISLVPFHDYSLLMYTKEDNQVSSRIQTALYFPQYKIAPCEFPILDPSRLAFSMEIRYVDFRSQDASGFTYDDNNIIFIHSPGTDQEC